jgi:hypothetical protein
MHFLLTRTAYRDEVVLIGNGLRNILRDYIHDAVISKIL